MKNLALVLGALLTVGSGVMAKEAIVIPTEISKEIIVAAEPVIEEVIVVEKQAFKPSGKFGLEYKAYGKTEGHGDGVRVSDIITPDQDTWNREANDYARLQTTFGIQMTEKSRVDVRVRDYNNLNRSDKSNETKKTGSETRIRYTYQHIPKFASRLEYKDTTKNKQFYEYRGIWKAYRDKGALLSDFIVEPYYANEQPTDGGGNYYNAIGTKFQVLGNLFAGFTYEFNTYFQETFYNQDIQVTKNSSKDKEFQVEIEAYLYNSFEVYSNDKYTLELNFEGGYDPYTFSQYGRYDKKDKTVSDKNEYTLYAEFDLALIYQVSPSVSVTGGVGAKYENWDYTAEKSARDWRWQPFAYIATNVKF